MTKFNSTNVVELTQLLRNVVNSFSELTTFAEGLATCGTLCTLPNNNDDDNNNSSSSSLAFGGAPRFAPRLLLLLGSVRRVPRVARPRTNVNNAETE
jgi:hypothetical protein